MSGGKVLVVLPTLGDRIAYLEETLCTVDAERKRVDLTLVIVLPAGALEARRVAEAHQAVVVEDPQKGISGAINAGIRAATSEEYYAWMGDDDLFRPGALTELRNLLKANPDAVVAYGACDYIDPAGRVIGTSGAGKAAQWLLPWGPDLIPHPGSMIRLSALRDVGLFDTSLKYTMDLDVFLKLRSRGRFVCTRRSVSAFRWHPESLTVSNRAASGREADAVKRRHLPRLLQPLSPAWHVPVQWAATLAAKRVTSRALSLARRQPEETR
ncbi:MAG: glycosyltransferase [Propionibacteriaceae bacterium]